MPALLITAVDHTNDTLTIPGHGQVTGNGPAAIRNLNGPFAMPGNLSEVTDYWLIVIDANTVKLADSSALALLGTARNISSNGTGTNYLEIGIPYRRARTYAALTQVRSADLNAKMDAFKALYALFTGQPQSIYNGVNLAHELEATVGPLAAFRDWKRQIRSTIDHFGYRGGWITEWEEQWKTAGAGAPPVGWGYSGTGVATLTDPTSTMRQRHLRLLALTGTTNITAQPEWTGYMTDDSEIALEFMVRTEGVSGGLCTNFTVGLQFESGGSNDDFVYFGGFGGVANWAAYTVVNGTQTPFDAGVAFAANTNYRFRIECIGSNNSSQAAGTFQYRFFINGVLVHTANLSTIVAGKFRPYLRAFSTAAGTPDALQVGRMRLQFNHVLAGDSV